MTENNFTTFKTELANIRAYSETTGTCLHIDVTAHLNNGDRVTVGTNTISEDGAKVDWSTSSPKLSDGIVYMYDYPQETSDTERTNATTVVTLGKKVEYTIPLDTILYFEINWTDRKVVTVESTSTAQTTAE